MVTEHAGLAQKLKMRRELLYFKKGIVPTY